MILDIYYINVFSGNGANSGESSQVRWHETWARQLHALGLYQPWGPCGFLDGLSDMAGWATNCAQENVLVLPRTANDSSNVGIYESSSNLPNASFAQNILTKRILRILTSSNWLMTFHLQPHSSGPSCLPPSPKGGEGGRRLLLLQNCNPTIFLLLCFFFCIVVKFTQYKVNHFKVNNSVPRSIHSAVQTLPLSTSKIFS